MKTSTLLLAALIALGAGISGNAMAHGDYGRGYEGDRHGRYEVYRKGHGHGHHKRKHRHWRHDDHRHGHSYWRPPVYRDSSYGIHLFFSGH